MKLFDELKEILAPASVMDEGSILPEHNIKTDLCIDSFGIMEVLITLEDKYDVTFPEKKIPSLITVQDVLDYMLQNMETSQEQGGNYETV